MGFSIFNLIYIFSRLNNFRSSCLDNYGPGHLSPYQHRQRLSVHMSAMPQYIGSPHSVEVHPQILQSGGPSLESEFFLRVQSSYFGNADFNLLLQTNCYGHAANIVYPI
jgi:hypothetical protein